MSPAEWIRLAECIKIAIIHFLNTAKTINVSICHPAIFAPNTLGL